ETLAEMIKALEQELKAGGGGGGGKGGGKDPPLVNLLQQLKMVFAMQRRVNSRTELYGKHYVGEQAPAAAADAKEKARLEDVHKELGDLSRRQERIGQVTRTIGKQNQRGVD
ncbi:MAG: hypothetical protein ACRC33_07775, partial [Gemmataceae bacterium]